MNWKIITPWHREDVRDQFLAAWRQDINAIPDWLILQHDANKEGCAVTKNRGIKRAIEQGAEVVIVLDSDCFPETRGGPYCLVELAEKHLHAMEPQEIPVFEVTTSPAARGVPYFNRALKIPVAASVGWWTQNPDRDATRQLIEGVQSPMAYQRRVIYKRPTMICGMNVAFRADFWPWFSFVEVSRMDDVFASWLFCKEVSRRNHCINLGGPDVRHARQSNVWASLRDEAPWLEKNETLWSDIWLHESNDYDTLRDLIPIKRIPV